MDSLPNYSTAQKLLVLSIGALAVVFIAYFTQEILKKNEPTNVVVTEEGTMKYFEGIVTYVDPRNFPDGDISYILSDSNGNEIILLASPDQKLSVVEGLSVRVVGTVRKALDARTDVLDVKEVIIKK